MKIGILTFHYAHNYGAVLQAFALMSKLKSMNHEVEFINYIIPRVEQVYNKRTLYQLYKCYNEKQSCIKSLVKTILNYKKEELKITPKWHRFNKFINETLPTSKRIENLDYKLLNSYDAIICGSDQIWSTGITQKLMPIYFCDGVNSNVRKIAYAGSAGKGYIDKELEKDFIKLCSNFNHISVRERALSNYIGELGIPNVWVADPVFLLKKEEWTEFAIKPAICDYVLTYSFGEPDGFFNKAKEIAKQMNKSLVCLVFKDKGLKIEATQIFDAGPKEFVGYFLNASCIVTNSFHGTAFSILLNKQFYNIPPQNGAERTNSLLTLFDLTDRIVDIKDNNSISTGIIDYEKVNNKISEFVSSSVKFIDDSLKI